MDLSSILRIVQVAVGIGLVIFVHELGHFLAARWCGVRVETFSLGFGPKLFGWTRGATTYQLAAVPLGGYVKMAGEEVAPGGEYAPDDLPAKSVGQRFFIYSGGVLMNVVFALLVFPPLLFFGVSFPEPLIGSVVPGGPAWQAGLQPGTRVLTVDDEPIYSFESLAQEIALSKDDVIEMRVISDEGDGAGVERIIEVRAPYDDAAGIRLIGVGPAADPQMRLRVDPDSAAFEAGLRDDDRLVAVGGASDRRIDRLDWATHRGDALDLEVVREGERHSLRLEPRVPKKRSRTAKLHVGPTFDRVIAVREDPSSDRLGLRADDRVLVVADRVIAHFGDFEQALLGAVGGELECVIERDGVEQRLNAGTIDQSTCDAILRNVAIGADGERTRVWLLPDGPARRAGMQDGDWIVRVGDTPVSSWTEVQAAIEQQARQGRTLVVSVGRRAPDGQRSYLDIDVVPEGMPTPEYGLHLLNATYVYRAGGAVEALEIGARSSWKFLGDTWHTLTGIFRGSVGSENLGGIISIGRISYDWAGMGVSKLIFFLCMLSLNLAFLNVLPIPVLDGGHLFFLLIEKVKGSPVNERVLGYSQMVGLVLILGLVVFVTFNDVRRLFDPS